MDETMNFKQLGVSLSYSRVQKLGDRLEGISDLIDWSKFKELLERKSKVGRPPYDPVLMIKMLVLQS